MVRRRRKGVGYRLPTIRKNTRNRRLSSRVSRAGGKQPRFAEGSWAESPIEAVKRRSLSNTTWELSDYQFARYYCPSLTYGGTYEAYVPIWDGVAKRPIVCSCDPAGQKHGGFLPTSYIPPTVSSFIPMCFYGVLYRDALPTMHRMMRPFKTCKSPAACLSSCIFCLLHTPRQSARRIHKAFALHTRVAYHRSRDARALTVFCGHMMAETCAQTLG